MACFVIPAAEAVITTVAAKVLEKKESAPETVQISMDGSVTEAVKIPFSQKLKWLNRLLWGGCALLAFEHVWHGEITPLFPFLTAVNSPAGAAEMLQEMATAGVGMTVLVTAVWGGMLAAAHLIEKRAVKSAQTLPTAKQENIL